MVDPISLESIPLKETTNRSTTPIKNTTTKDTAAEKVATEVAEPSEDLESAELTEAMEADKTVGAVQGEEGIMITSLQDFLEMDLADLPRVSSLGCQGADFQKDLEALQSGNKVNELADFITRLGQCSNLTKIVLDNCGITETVLTTIIDALPETVKTNLEALSLTGNQLLPSGKMILGKQLARLPNLQALDLHATGLDNLGVTSLCEGLTQLPKLQVLSLSNNKFGGRGLIFLANALANNHELNYLELRKSNLKDSDIESFCETMQETNPKLQIYTKKALLARTAQTTKQKRQEAAEKEHRHSRTSHKFYIAAAEQILYAKDVQGNFKLPNTVVSLERLKQDKHNARLVKAILLKIGKQANQVQLDDLAVATVINKYTQQYTQPDNVGLTKDDVQKKHTNSAQDPDNKKAVLMVRPKARYAFTEIKKGARGPLLETIKVLDEVKQAPGGDEKQFWIVGALHNMICEGVSSDKEIARMAKYYAEQDVGKVKEVCMQILYPEKAAKSSSMVKPESAVTPDKLEELIRESKPEEERKTAQLLLDRNRRNSPYDQLHPEQGIISQHQDLRDLHSDAEMNHLAQEVFEIKHNPEAYHNAKLFKKIEMQLQKRQMWQSQKIEQGMKSLATPTPNIAWEAKPVANKDAIAESETTQKDATQDRLFMAVEKEQMAEQHKVAEQQALAEKNLTKDDELGIGM